MNAQRLMDDAKLKAGRACTVNAISGKSYSANGTLTVRPMVIGPFRGALSPGDYCLLQVRIETTKQCGTFLYANGILFLFMCFCFLPFFPFKADI